MKKLIAPILAFLLFSCTSDSQIEESPLVTYSPNKIELKINDSKISDQITNIDAFYSCDRNVSIFVTSKKNNVTSDLIVFRLTKSGQLQSVSYADKSGSFREEYNTPDFIPGSTMTITEFEFIENVKLKFKFSGHIFKKKYNLLQPNETLQIQGNVDINIFSKSTCNAFINFIKLDNQIEFNNITRINQGNLPVRYEANSLNGYHIKLINLSQNIPDMPLGTYSFTNLSQSGKIEFSKYVGTPKFFSTITLIPADWKSYETEGSFTIVSKTVINGFQVVKLKLNFSATYNGIVAYNFSDANFETAY